MILTNLKHYILAHPNCSLTELAKAFNLSEDGIMAMLSIWQKKGQLKTIIDKKNGLTQYRYAWLEKNELAIHFYR